MNTAFVIKVVIPLSLLALGLLLFEVESKRPPRHFNRRQATMIQSLHTAAPTGKEELK